MFVPHMVLVTVIAARHTRLSVARLVTLLVLARDVEPDIVVTVARDLIVTYLVI